MKHAAPEIFENRQPLPAATPSLPGWRERLSAWWCRVGWDRNAVTEALRSDVEPDHPSARPVRGRAEWERRL